MEEAFSRGELEWKRSRTYSLSKLSIKSSDTQYLEDFKFCLRLSKKCVIQFEVRIFFIAFSRGKRAPALEKGGHSHPLLVGCWPLEYEEDISWRENGVIEGERASETHTNWMKSINGSCCPSAVQPAHFRAAVKLTIA
ncbi:hypothetical protein EVAR_17525_1 [Eumeta japonica]|uniref:Uncharacterized protein n=1 Tax=Eumeta variegata TaxID=151549 RepID=A0A4C1WRH3_EUMVA|nr:hypothetical protein EVAR_17525_1 [Eumeta japonica]